MNIMGEKEERYTLTPKGRLMGLILDELGDYELALQIANRIAFSGLLKLEWDIVENVEQFKELHPETVVLASDGMVDRAKDWYHVGKFDENLEEYLPAVVVLGHEDKASLLLELQTEKENN